ncbi:MAG: chromosome segregation ATPase [Natrialbaceae archaeon]|jgi:chromosome segregation ATPase
MELHQESDPVAKVHAENIGGIRETSVEFSPGVTILEGRNATNRTSFLQSVMAALGSENVALKADADEARVELTLGDETYTRSLHRQGQDVFTDGDPYLEDPTLADLFAFLLESNEARRAVTTGQDLRDLIMRPVDTDQIKSDIEQLVEERQRLEEDLEEIQDLKGELPELEEERTHLQTEIEEKKTELEAKEAELESTDATVEETRAEKSELEDRLEDLRSKRSQLEDVRYDLETEQESLNSLEQEQRELQDEGDELPETPVGDIDELDSEISRLRNQKQQLEAEVNELQSVIGFNEERLDEGESDTFAELTETDTENLTDQLVEDSGVTCWSCGSSVEQEQIESTIDQLRELSQSKVAEASELSSEISDFQEEKRELEQAQRERDRIERRQSEIEDEIEQTEATIEQFRQRRDELTAEIETIEAEVEELESEEYSEVLDLHKEANQLEYELGRLEGDLEDIQSEIEQIEDRIESEAAVQDQIAELNTEIEDLRTKIERIEQGAVDQFNEHMETVLDLLGYTNIDRIWLERSQREVREGRRTVTKSVFDLHIVRISESGAAYEDTIDNLSESEREVTGLVFALAGYLAHEVYEDLPFILLDSLEALDSERIAALVEYLTDYTGYLLVALLPEDAAALPEGYSRIDDL